MIGTRPGVAGVVPAAEGIAAGFRRSMERYPDRPALVVGEEIHTYRALWERCTALAATIQRHDESGSGLTAVLAHRSTTAYAGTLGALTAGRGYVPLNPKFPVARLQKMLAASGSGTLVVGAEARGLLPDLLGSLPSGLLVVAADFDDVEQYQGAFPRHRFIGARTLASEARHTFEPPSQLSDIAYLLFTSGSTGEPKGVPIGHSSVRAYLRYTCDRYDVTEHDRFSQMFDATFDLSVHDMFVCWERGACLFSVPERATMAPAKFIRQQELTMWFSVPSVVALLSRMRLLTPGAFPSLRWSLFCGEPLPAVAAQAWQAAAPNSQVENLYGPTEATIAITHYRWQTDVSPGQCVNGVAPIGWPYMGHRAQVFGDGAKPAAIGESGELWLSGPQVTTGYWLDPDRTRLQFVLAADGSGPWYRTGDLVRQDDTGCLYYLGRIDHQVKVRGYRVELQEVEAVLRKITGATQVAAVAWPVHHGSADGIVAFATGTAMPSPESSLAACRSLLPEYMVPTRLFYLQDFPLNTNGKIDRHRLTDLVASANE